MIRNRRPENLHRLIREIVQEELARSRNVKAGAEEERREPPESDEREIPFRGTAEMPGEEPGLLPPRAIFGSPRPAPDRQKRKTGRNTGWVGPFEPDHGLDPSPYMPHKRSHR
ncbi:hypothetical protein C8P63_10174 [Melghirimyces profundicolus]|uniref:Uncharacterized protein n=1 Tax=Melghirimyces profundicolus TaxID=1242148 RepID=A0A2T6C9B2_9BACL|nr:hypothetical protein [Melghirimyces profundicolus]PTX64856.1 hypothetical protein C8P63_10174 [Melghirimyces profundicolus]